jgi:hypothetical protein
MCLCYHVLPDLDLLLRFDDKSAEIPYFTFLRGAASESYAARGTGSTTSSVSTHSRVHGASLYSNHACPRYCTPDAAQGCVALLCLCGVSVVSWKFEHLVAAHYRDANSRGRSNTTPLHATSVKRHLDVTLLLLENSNSRDNRGMAPL